MRSPFIITVTDLIREQEQQVDYYRKLLENKRNSGERNLDYIIRKINLADRTRQILQRFKKDPQLDIFIVNAQLNQRSNGTRRNTGIKEVRS